jgi:catechol 2,3-dioxygenase-like lactoylglutathione lyase family enzyme
MIDHLSIAVRDLEKSAAFYAAVLAPLELSRLVERPDRIGFGKRYPELWLNARPRQVPRP